MLIILSSLCRRALSSTYTHPRFLRGVIHIFFRHIATEAECLALAKEGWGLCPIKRPSFSTGDARAASHISVWRGKERERERDGKGMISPRRWERGKTLLCSDCCRGTPYLGVLSSPSSLLTLLTFEYFVGRSKLSAISSIISSRFS